VAKRPRLSVSGSAALPGEERFRWHDAERLIVFGPESLARALEVLRERGWERFELLTTQRALNEAPLELPDESDRMHLVPDGQVHEVAAQLIGDVTASSLVALGGGRVIDVAKAIAAVRGGRVAALPTTLSGAEMTKIHRLPEGHEAERLLRPEIVVAEPEAMCGLPEERLRASAMNALAHGAEPLYTPFANPVSSLASLRGASLIAAGLDGDPGGVDAPKLALGALLCAYSLDEGGFALHHVVCQSLVRVLELPHAETNATMLPRTLDAMIPRAEKAMVALAGALAAEPGELRARVEALGGGRRRLSDLGADESRLDAALDAIEARGELQLTPDPPGRAELRAMIEDAW
jgi:alcohol dehydrogenase class IV